MPRENPGHVYVGVVDAVAVSAAQDVFELTAPSDKSVIIRRVEIGQDTSETSEVLPVKLVVGVGSTAGSGGATVVPVRLKSPRAGLAATSTLKRNNTTAQTAGSGTLYTVGKRDFNIVTGFLYEPTDLQAIVLAPSERFTVNLPTAPGASITVSAEIIFEEVF